MIPGYVEFEFDLPGALLSQVVKAFDNIAPAPLSAKSTARVPEEQGVYELFHRGKLVYVGKTDSEDGLRKRLTRHASKILGRNGLDPADVSFKALRVFVFTALDIESDLIRHHGGVKSVPWNGSGFGSNDPGRERDTTAIEPDSFDSLFPIDLDLRVEPRGTGPISVADALDGLKSAMSFVVRYQKAGGGRKPHPDLVASTFGSPSKVSSLRAFLDAVAVSLPSGWQVTVLPGYVIVYKEAREYPAALQVYRS